MARPRRTTPAGADTREHVLAAAMRLIATRGYASTRLTAVADEAGVSLGLVQHYFRTRDGLLRAAFEAGTSASLARAETIALMPGRARDRLELLLAYMCSDGIDPIEGSWGFWLDLSLAALREPGLGLAVASAGSVWTALLAQLLEEGIRDGSVAARRLPDHLAPDLLALVYGVMMVEGPRAAEGATAARRVMRALDLAADTPPSEAPALT